MKPQNSVDEPLKFNRWKTNFMETREIRMDSEFDELSNCAFWMSEIREKVKEKKEKTKFSSYIFNETTEECRRNFAI